MTEVRRLLLNPFLGGYKNSLRPSSLMIVLFCGPKGPKSSTFYHLHSISFERAQIYSLYVRNDSNKYKHSPLAQKCSRNNPQKNTKEFSHMANMLEPHVTEDDVIATRDEISRTRAEISQVMKFHSVALLLPVQYPLHPHFQKQMTTVMLNS